MGLILETCRCVERGVSVEFVEVLRMNAREHNLDLFQQQLKLLVVRVGALIHQSLDGLKFTKQILQSCPELWSLRLALHPLLADLSLDTETVSVRVASCFT